MLMIDNTYEVLDIHVHTPIDGLYLYITPIRRRQDFHAYGLSWNFLIRVGIGWHGKIMIWEGLINVWLLYYISNEGGLERGI